MRDLISDFAIHVGTATALGPNAGESGDYHRREADWREKELRAFIAALSLELREHLKTATDPERIAIGNALLEAHPKLTERSKP